MNVRAELEAGNRVYGYFSGHRGEIRVEIQSVFDDGAMIGVGDNDTEYVLAPRDLYALTSEAA